MASASSYKQDMPPAGGYKPIPYKRIPAKTFFSGWALIGGYLGMTAGAGYIYYLTCKEIHATELEARSASFAITPMLVAERDRAYLKQLRKNRESERELMKNVEGWKVGTWYGEPIYHDQKPDTLLNPSYHEYYCHMSWKDYMKRADLSQLS